MYPYLKTKSNKVCSRGCVHNYTNYGQKPPRWQFCGCCPKDKISLKEN